MGDQFERECLEAHNNHRRKHGAPPLVLDRQICNVAQNWANTIAARNVMQHSSGTGYGENIYASMGQAVNGKAPVDAWYSEIKDYRYGSGFSMATGHFTQVVWKGSTKMGVGRATNGRGWTYVVANYSPPGNYAGQFSTNVLPPGNYFTEEPKPAVKEDLSKDVGKLQVTDKAEEKEKPNNKACTLINEKGKMSQQMWYNCATCRLLDGKIVCKNCVKMCHKGHDVTPANGNEGYCDCSAECQAIPTQLCTTPAKGQYVRQHYYNCKTCGLVDNRGVCYMCVKICHKGHELNYAKFSDFFCDCGYNAHGKCQADNKTIHELCTFITDKGALREQQWHHCQTCDEDLSLCDTCSKVCHKGHNIVKGDVEKSFCDCGSSEDGSCKATELK